MLASMLSAPCKFMCLIQLHHQPIDSIWIGFNWTPCLSMDIYAGAMLEHNLPIDCFESLSDSTNRRSRNEYQSIGWNDAPAGISMLAPCNTLYIICKFMLVALRYQSVWMGNYSMNIHAGHLHHANVCKFSPKSAVELKCARWIYERVQIGCHRAAATFHHRSH